MTATKVQRVGFVVVASIVLLTTGLVLGDVTSGFDLRAEKASLEAGIGLAFRCRSASDCWVLSAVPQFGTWRVVRIENGRVINVGNLGVVPIDRGTSVEVRTQGREIAVVVNDAAEFRFRDEHPAPASRVGLAFLGSGDVRRARWSDVRVVGPGGDRPLAGTRVTPVAGSWHVGDSTVRIDDPSGVPMPLLLAGRPAAPSQSSAVRAVFGGYSGPLKGAP